MDIKKLEVFINAVDLGSLTKVAEIMGYTQSGITHMISGLEKELGFPLLVRSHSGVFPTSEGKRLIPIIRTMLIHSEQFDKEVSMIRRNKNDSIKVCAYTSIIMHWLPHIIRRFHEKLPDVSVEISSSSIDGVYSMVSSGEVDIALASRQDYPNLEFIHLHDDPLLAILPNNDKYARLDSYPIKEFDGQDFIMPYYGFDKDIVRFFEKDNVQPDIEPTYVDDPTVIYMVEHGMGVSILSELVMHGNKNDVISLPITPAAHRELVICLKSMKAASENTKIFINCAKEVVEELYNEQ